MPCYPSWKAAEGEGRRTNMHIALVIPSLDTIAGAESQVLLLAEGLHGRGRRVHAVGEPDGGVPAGPDDGVGASHRPLDRPQGCGR